MLRRASRSIAPLLERAFGEDRDGDWRLVPTQANRMPTAASYLRRPGDTEFRAFKFDVLRIEGGRHRGDHDVRRRPVPGVRPAGGAREGRRPCRLEEGRRVEQVALARGQEDDLRRRLLEDLERLELEVAVGERVRAQPLRLRLAAGALDLLLRLGLRLLDLLPGGERVLRRHLLALDRLA